MLANPLISISVVSHSHGSLVTRALKSLSAVCNCTALECIVTKNLPEKIDYPASLKVREVENLRPRGFAQNHNRAFEISRGEYFCILNPDVVFEEDVFGYLIERLKSEPRSVVAPLVYGPDNKVQDSFRQDITVWKLLRRKLLGWQDYNYEVLARSGCRISPDLIGGMFLLLSRQIYQELKGLDERYWLYCEDADFARRARQLGVNSYVYPSVSIVHSAQRAGRRIPWFFALHLRSMIRYLWGF